MFLHEAEIKPLYGFIFIIYTYSQGVIYFFGVHMHGYYIFVAIQAEFQ